MGRNLKEKLVEIANLRFGVRSSEIGMITLQNSKKEYKKAGIDVASDVMSFIIFDNDLNKIGVIKRSDLKKEQM
jgi:hypothetical protein